MKHTKTLFTLLLVVIFISISNVSSKKSRRLKNANGFAIGKYRRNVVVAQPIATATPVLAAVPVAAIPAPVRAAAPVATIPTPAPVVETLASTPVATILTPAPVAETLASAPNAVVIYPKSVEAPAPVASAAAVVQVAPVAPASAPSRTAVEKSSATLPTGFYTVPVYGSDNLKYYFADLWVGTPAQKQSVIVDTGSDYLAFPCSYCAAGNCGNHKDPVLDMSKDTAAKPMACQGTFENFKCSNHCFKNQCGFNRKYMEGSSLEGIVFQDYIGVVAPEKVQTGNAQKKLITPAKKDVAKFPQA